MSFTSVVPHILYVSRRRHDNAFETRYRKKFTFFQTSAFTDCICTSHEHVNNHAEDGCTCYTLILINTHGRQFLQHKGTLTTNSKPCGVPRCGTTSFSAQCGQRHVTLRHIMLPQCGTTSRDTTSHHSGTVWTTSRDTVSHHVGTVW